MRSLPALFAGLPEPWRPMVLKRLDDAKLKGLARRFQKRLDENIQVFPPKSRWFRALELVDPGSCKCVILGQDPYPTKGDADGLAFSVNPGHPLPLSLRNIFAELESDLGLPPPKSGDLTGWARQGVLLLNTCLTVEDGKTHSHRGLCWEPITSALLGGLSEAQDNIAFVLWGLHAKRYKKLIDEPPHRIFSSSHPSPLAVNKNPIDNFLGSKVFSEVNKFLASRGRVPIAWG